MTELDIEIQNLLSLLSDVMASYNEIVGCLLLLPSFSLDPNPVLLFFRRWTDCVSCEEIYSTWNLSETQL